MPADVALDPENRRLYTEILRPPAGYELELALATTYSLDFETALVIPATMALHAAESRAETLDSPIALLEGLERMSERLVIFCETGRIHGVPKGVNRLCGLLEHMIVETEAPRGGAFHPKLWVMRFAGQGDLPPMVRLALLSRNLTTDASWDLALMLDGELGEEHPPENAPLSRLLDALPDLARPHPAPAKAGDIARSLAADVARTGWRLPDGYNDISFAVNGLDAAVWSPAAEPVMAVISPFCDADTLCHLVPSWVRQAHLVGRAEELAGIDGGTLGRFTSVKVLDDLIETEEVEEALETRRADPPARGLHAKAVISQRYSTVSVTVGSGNATGPAMRRGSNVEVFATLKGHAGRVGSVEDQLARMAPFLRDHDPSLPIDAPENAEAEKRLEEARRALSRWPLVLACRRDGQEQVSLTLRAEPSSVPVGPVDVEIWPAVLGGNRAVNANAVLTGAEVDLGQVALRDVTRWLGIRLSDRDSGLTQVFSLGARLEGLPEGRNAEILRAFIDNRDAFYRYLRFLLEGADLQGVLTQDKSGQDHWDGADFLSGDGPILERMVAALTRDQNRIDEIARLIERLQPSPGEEDGPVPSDFLELWGAFDAVRRDMKGAAGD